MTNLTKKDNPLKWFSEHQEAFENLKEILCSVPVLPFPDYKKKFTLTTDASNVGLGAVLSQDGHPSCFVSRKLNVAEQNYSTSEKEFLAIVWATQLLRQYLLGRTFNIQTGHQALKWLHNVKNPLSRLLRWRLRLEEFNYNPIEYIKGKENKVADFLSRLFSMRGIIQGTIDDARISPDELKTQLPHIKEIDLENTRYLNTPPRSSEKRMGKASLEEETITEPIIGKPAEFTEEIPEKQPFLEYYKDLFQNTRIGLKIKQVQKQLKNLLLGEN